MSQVSPIKVENRGVQKVSAMVGRRGQRANVDECQLTIAAQLLVRHQNRSVRPSCVDSGSFSGAFTVMPLTALSIRLVHSMSGPGTRQTARSSSSLRVGIDRMLYNSRLYSILAPNFIPWIHLHPTDTSP